MKLKIFFLFSLLFTTNNIAFSQLQLNDVRDMAMGNSTIASSSSNNITRNIAILPGEKKTLISLGVLSNYYIKEISPVFLSFLKSFNENLSLNFGVGRMGNESFSEEFFEAGLAKKLGNKFSTGIKIQYHRWILNDAHYENSNSFIPSIYLFASPLKNLCFGVIILNPVRSRMNAIEQNKLPATINTGIACRLSDKVQLSCSVTQQTNLPFSSQFGLEYIYHPKFIIRFGWHTLPVSETFGFALRFARFNLDVALQTHPQLGNSSAIGLTFSL